MSDRKLSHQTKAQRVAFTAAYIATLIAPVLMFAVAILFWRSPHADVEQKRTILIELLIATGMALPLGLRRFPTWARILIGFIYLVIVFVTALQIVGEIFPFPFGGVMI